MATAEWRGFPFAAPADDNNQEKLAPDTVRDESPAPGRATTVRAEPPPTKKKKVWDESPAPVTSPATIGAAEPPARTVESSSLPAAKPPKIPSVARPPFIPLHLKRISQGRLSVTPGWLPASLVERLRGDAVSLHAAGAFTPGALGGRTGKLETAKRIRQCEVCGLFDDAARAGARVGDPAAREELFDALAGLRAQLEDPAGIGHPLAEHMELQYLRYPGGGAGFYGRHLDQQAIDLGRSNNRWV